MSIQFWVSLLLIGVAAMGIAFLLLLLAFVFQSLNFLILFAIFTIIGGLLCYFGLGGINREAARRAAEFWDRQSRRAFTFTFEQAFEWTWTNAGYTDQRSYRVEQPQRYPATPDYYKLLGVSRDADADNIKKVYRALALKYHPDVCKTPGAEDKFKMINEAYHTLSDSQRRLQYDRQNW